MKVWQNNSQAVSGYYYDEYSTARHGSSFVKQSCVKLLGLKGKTWLWKEKIKGYFGVDLKWVTEFSKRTMKLKSHILFWRPWPRTLHPSNVKCLLSDVDMILQVSPQQKYSIRKSLALSKPF